MAQFPFWNFVFGGAGPLPTRPDIIVLLSTFIAILYYFCVYLSVTNWHTLRDVWCCWHEL